MNTRWLKALFVVAGLYDGVLALAFLLFWKSIFGAFGVTPPNHPGYVEFTALMLLLFAVMFFQIARDPIKHRSFIPYGISLKAAYSGTVFWHQFIGDIPAMWIPWAWADLTFLLLFLVAFKITGTASASAS